MCDRSLVLGAQLTTTRALPLRPLPPADDSEASDGEAAHGQDYRQQFDVLGALEAFRTGLKLRLGYWPALVYNDPSLRETDWQGSFVASSSDSTEFAALMHCLIDMTT